MKRLLLMMPLLLVAAPAAVAQSPYAGEETRPIKSLSSQQIAGLRAGKGMGFARLAELNGYPGPRHVLDLADELALSADQRRESEAIHADMKAAAIALGEELILAEAALDLAFAEGSIDHDSLAVRLTEIGEIRARLRLVHMAAHLKQTELLTDTQISTYNSLRGYR